MAKDKIKSLLQLLNKDNSKSHTVNEHLQKLGLLNYEDKYSFLEHLQSENYLKFSDNSPVAGTARLSSRSVAEALFSEKEYEFKARILGAGVNYINSQSANTRSKWALSLSIVAILVACCMPLLKYMELKNAFNQDKEIHTSSKK